ncbi:hypothetical protein AMJ85_10835 [candidate division BRC1 bacterium SM23_51]|nr:MAG: hypothetical protein AMJ85_10835 [candidate division BRC1 bacterium SM23_51]
MVLLLVLPAVAQEDEIIKAIEIQGLNKVSREKVLYALPVKVGKPYRPRQPGEVIHAVYDLGCFSEDIKLFTEKVEGGINLILIVRENPTIEEVEFIGNTKIPTRALRGACPVKAGDLIAPDSAQKIKSAIEKVYRTKGYSNASVLVNAADQGTTQTIAQVVIDEGEKLKIRDLIIRGNKSVPTAVLRLQLENKGSWLFIKNYYNSESFRDDLDMVRLYYLTRGYFDVRVRAGEFISAPEGGWVSPVIKIEAGQRYRVGEIRPSGFTLFMREQIVEPFKPVQGRHYRAERFRDCLQKVKDLYGDEGYIDAEIYPDYDTDRESGLVHFDLRIEEHERVYVRKILIRKNEYPAEGENFVERLHGRLSPPVGDQVIQREVLLKPGEAYRRFEEVASVDRLHSLGIFDSVEAEAALTDNQTERDLLLTVEEGNTGNVIVGVGLSELAGAYVHGGYINRNLFGEARHLRTSFLLGTRDIQFRIGYLDRYFNLPGTWLDQYFKGDPSGLVPFRFEIYRDALRLREYEETHTGVSALLTRVLRPGYLSEDWGLRLEYVETEEDGYHRAHRWGYFGTRNGDDGDEDTEEDFNTTDDWWWPTRGHILGGGAEVGFADGPLVKLTGRYSRYKKLSDRLIYALNTKLGWMPLDADSVGISERLFMGGASDLRGFAFRGAGPVDDKNDDLHIGGSLKLLAQNELRFPIYKQLKGFAFLDAGMLGEGPFELDTPRASGGVGVRFSTAKARRYGPRWKTGITGVDLMRGFHVEVSLGAPILKDSDDDTQFLHFVLGSAF